MLSENSLEKRHASSSDSYGGGIDYTDGWSTVDESDGIGHDPHNSVYSYFEK